MAIHIHFHDDLEDELDKVVAEIEKLQDRGVTIPTSLIARRDQLVTQKRNSKVASINVSKEEGLRRLAGLKETLGRGDK